MGVCNKQLLYGKADFSMGKCLYECQVSLRFDKLVRCIFEEYSFTYYTIEANYMESGQFGYSTLCSSSYTAFNLQHLVNLLSDNIKILEYNIIIYNIIGKYNWKIIASHIM